MFKAITTRKLFPRKPKVKMELWVCEFWADGYFIATVERIKRVVEI